MTVAKKGNPISYIASQRSGDEMNRHRIRLRERVMGGLGGVERHHPYSIIMIIMITYCVVGRFCSKYK